ncbi:MAG TPA: hydroxyisourate hydrolase [Acidobacteriaceae bacterium]|nr:hydroxyisourate hydrolase [Acidobacteriaceae bacterium]
MGLSTHILDTHLGRPAAGVPIALSQLCDGAWQPIGSAKTDADGRAKTLLGERGLETGEYRLRFETAEYFKRLGTATLYPYVEIVFRVADPAQHYHIPLLLAANGYATYRGS